jgi:uncharacterized protein (DUF433 family)
MFSEAEAARLLRVPQSTLHYWLEGGDRRGRTYKPVIRPEPRGSRSVTWAEFVEAGWLKEYRQRQVPMAELRAFIDRLREDFGVPYPLAHQRPLVSSRELVLEAQEATGLSAEYCLVAVGYRPDSNPESPVRISPDVRFGRPAIKGISTEVLWEQAEVLWEQAEVLWEQADSGEDVDEIADVYGLTVADVHWALAYENSLRAA